MDTLETPIADNIVSAMARKLLNVIYMNQADNQLKLLLFKSITKSISDLYAL